MMRRHPFVLVLAGSLALAAARPASAQNVVEAEALFERGVSEMKLGLFKTACPAIAESQRLDPRPGTLFTLADCESRAGRIATAAAHFEDYLRVYATLPADKQKQHASRMETAKSQIPVLKKESPRLTITLPEGAPPGATVSRDGTTLGAAVLGVALPIDPGDHSLVLTLPDGRKSEKQVRLSKGEDITVELELPAAKPTVDEGKGAGRADVKEKKPKPPQTVDSGVLPPAPREDGGAGLRAGGYVALGFGAVGFLGFAVTGVMAMQDAEVRDENCPAKQCNDVGMDAYERGKTLANVATLGLGLGIAGSVAGATMLFFGRRGTGAPAKPQVGVHVDFGPGQGFVNLSGAF